MTALTEVAVGRDAPTWAALGFVVAADGAIALGGVTLRAGEDVALGFDGLPAGARLDGLPLRDPRPAPRAPRAHANGASAVDHVVVATPSVVRTTAALAVAGLEVRATREVPGHRPLRQAFVLAGPCLLEVVGPPDGADAAPASVWGLTVVVPDVDSLARDRAALVGTPGDAVQPGRRIVTARAAAALSLRVAFMTPRHAR